MLSYLQGSTWSEISMAIKQCARFLNNPHLMHKRAVRRIVKYLAIIPKYMDILDGNRGLTKIGVVYRPNTEKNHRVLCR